MFKRQKDPRSSNGLMPESAPMPRELHPGLRGWLPPYHVPHASLSYSQIPQNIQGTPRRWFTRGGARPALDAMNTPPPVFAFLLAHVRQTPKVGTNNRVLVAQTQRPIGVIH